MFSVLDDIFYAPVLKWKLGETGALRCMSDARKRRMLPIFLIPRAGDFDHLEGRVLSPAEHIGTFGSRMHHQWGRRFAFIDAELLDDDEHKQAVIEHPLTALIGRARHAGALVSPVTSIGRSEGYQLAVARFVRANAELPICIKVAPLSVEQRSFTQKLEELLGELKCRPAQVFLLFDTVPADLQQHRAFAELIIERLNHLPFLHDWAGLALAATSFPSQLQIKAGEVGCFERNDWKVFLELTAKRERLLRPPLFADYTVEYPQFPAAVRVAPSTQFRISGDAHYFVFKGPQAKGKFGYNHIFKVADRVAEHNVFHDLPNCDGLEFITRLSHQKARIGKQKTGNASSWRRASINVHLTVVTNQLSQLLGISLEEAVVKAPVQLELLDS